ncbi:hypothetical protein DICVIV_12955 [Dictyocaulus viviparus]|uniref:Uncharacterized protein n=1 Tax=Dictyocaulus viviparus TaxID=29172 RepID=A0A0D8X914_DICVI|nr:hypothetical protein DICVIV_12955 [Dictyocaulus viviparus]
MPKHSLFRNFQVAPFLFQSGHVVGGSTALPFGSGSPVAPGYGYGTWGTIYSSHSSAPPSNSDCFSKGGGILNGGPATISASVFSTSPPFYQNPVVGVTSSLSNLSIGGHQITNQLRSDLGQTFQGTPPTLSNFPASHMMYMQYSNQSNPQTPSLNSSPTFFGSAVNGIPSMNAALPSYVTSRAPLLSVQPQSHSTAPFSTISQRRLLDENNARSVVN